jgi:hypothetical protein
VTGGSWVGLVDWYSGQSYQMLPSNQSMVNDADRRDDRGMTARRVRGRGRGSG